MLDAIRKRTGSLPVKILLGLLILSFAVWGVGDMVRRVVTPSSAASVGDLEIPLQELDWEFRREVERMRNAFGPDFDSQKARAMGFRQATLNRLIEGALIDQGAASLGVAVSDDQIRDQIHSIKGFKNELGQFDRFVFDQAMRNNGLTEKHFIALLRRDMSRQQYLQSLTEAARAPKAMAEVLYRHKHQRRVAQVIRFDDAATPDPGAPDQAALEAFHKANAARYTAPESRALTVLALDAAGLAKEIAVSDEELRAAYDQRADQFNSPERRTLRQALFQDESKARAFADAARAAGDFAKAAKDSGVTVVDLGTSTKADMLPELADAAFALAPGAVGDPTQTPLGWHVLQAVKVTSAGVQTLDQVKDELRAVVAHEKAIDSLYDMANRVEDALGGGATLEETAERFDIGLRKVAGVNRQGRDPQGSEVKGLPALDVLIRTAFETEENTESLLTESGDEGYFIVRVDRVTPPALRPLDTVRDKVAKDWAADKRREAADAKAKTARERLSAGAEAASVAAETGGALSTTSAFTRKGDGAPADMPQPLVEQLFTLAVNDLAGTRTQGASWVARLVAIKDADPTQDPKGVDAVAEETAEPFEGDVLTQLSGALKVAFPVRVNAAALNDDLR